jgi:peptidoglycan/LPS O-acetylase OafA/YrhL
LRDLSRVNSSREPVNFVEKRVQGIDVLRGLCIIAVVVHHINLRIRFQQSAAGHLIGLAANRVLFWSGYYGVRVFFVISGFLIATWSLKRWGLLRAMDRRDFYLMRFARIVPCLAALLLLLSVLHMTGTPQFVINPQRASLPRALLAGVTFHINWLEAKAGYLPAGWDVLWSLSVEEVFYIFFPLLWMWLRKPWLVIATLVAFVAAGPFARVLTHNELWADYGYLQCMDGIALGCLAALFNVKVRLPIRANQLFSLGGTALCLLIVVFRGTAAKIGFYKLGLDVTVLEMGTALLLIALQQNFERAAGTPSRSRSGSLLFTKQILQWFGRSSYEVYLTHMLVVWPMVMLFFHFHLSLEMAPLWFVAATALAGLAGYGVARFYSEPVNRRLRKVFLTSRREDAMEAVAD